MFDYRLSEQVTKLQQFLDDRSGIGANIISSPLTNTIVANPSTSANLVDELASVEQRLTDLEYRFDRFESLLVRSSNYNPKSEHVNLSLLEQMHANFETTMSKLHLALKQTIDNQQKLESTDCKKPAVECRSSNVKLEKFVCDLEEQTVRAEVNTKQLQSDVNDLTVLHSVAVDRHEVLCALVSNVNNEHKELAEFVRQLSQCTASADDVVELKAVVECMARVNGMSERKTEQLITDFIGRDSVELEHLKRELQLVDEKIRELLLARNYMASMHDSPYQNQLPYLNVVTETMQGECERYKRDLNAIADRLSERLNAKVVQAIQQSLVAKHQDNNAAHFDLPSSEDQDTKPQPSVSTRSSTKLSTDLILPADDKNAIFVEAAAETAALQNETEVKRFQVSNTKIKDTVISSPPPQLRYQQTIVQSTQVCRVRNSFQNQVIR
jgi:hypothetical protein